ncbi:MAG TPA: hypothetical protein VFC19_27165 [Candidatus Limnocylindrales bacterium]|nr:hypothetical protein [Candidatus Limnocylindrales bacterium]
MRQLFLGCLALHVLAGLTAVFSGALAASARKRPGRHPKAGRVYLWAITAVFVTATVMAMIRWREDWHLFVIAVVAGGLALWGWRSRLRAGRGTVRWHAIGMGGSYIALLTGFYVDNGPQIPLWDRLPHWMYWVLPAAIGIPLISLALRRFRSGVSTRPRSTASAAEKL